MLALALLGGCSLAPGDVLPESMAKHNSLDGQALLRQLIADGFVRPATQADIDAYTKVAVQAQPEGSGPLRTPSLMPDWTLVLLRPFKVQPDMGSLNTRQIIVPAGVGKNDDPNPLFNYYYLENGRCNVMGSNCLGAPKWSPELMERERRREGLKTDFEKREEAAWKDQGTWGPPPPETTSRPASALEQAME